jgi:hypothetical protein
MLSRFITILIVTRLILLITLLLQSHLHIETGLKESRSPSFNIQGPLIVRSHSYKTSFHGLLIIPLSNVTLIFLLVMDISSLEQILVLLDRHTLLLINYLIALPDQNLYSPHLHFLYRTYLYCEINSTLHY